MMHIQIDPKDKQTDPSIFEWIRVPAIFVLLCSIMFVYFYRHDDLRNVVVRSIQEHQYREQSKLANTTRPTDASEASFNPNLEYSGLYAQYHMPALSRSVFDVDDVHTHMDILKRDKCDRKALYAIINALSENSRKREAISLLTGFSKVCPNTNADIIAAGNIYYEMGEYQDALNIAEKAIHDDPSAYLAIFLRAKALQKLERYSEALGSYVDITKVIANQSMIKSEVFTDMAAAYAAIGKYCEAASAIQMFVAFDYEKRMNNTYKKEIENYENLGSCGSGYASGDRETLQIAQGSYITDITINGVKGRFVVDTGASFVSLTPSFSAKAHLTNMSGEMVKMSTANGETEAQLVTLDTIDLGCLSARKVPGLVMVKSLQKGLDGLLGMSFLSRFKVSTEGKFMTISNPEISLSSETSEITE